MNVNIVASGEKWVGYGIKSTSSVVFDLIDSSKDKLIMTIYVLTSEVILEKIHRALNRGVSVDIYIHHKLTPKRYLMELKELSKEFDYLNFNISYDDFIHSKIIICDSMLVFIGSANLSNSGLTSNYELGVLLNDSDIAFEIENIINKLII